MNKDFSFAIFFRNFATKITFIKQIKHIIAVLLWVLAGLYTVAVVSLHIPVVQHSFVRAIENAVQEKLGTKVDIGTVSLGLLNRITVDEVMLYDQRGKEMVTCHRLSAKIDVLELLRGRIDITSAQIFGMNATLCRNTTESKLNCQFLIDSLASKDTVQTGGVNLRIASLVVRNSSVRYDVHSIAPKRGMLDLNHLTLKNISGHVMIDAITGDSTAVRLKKLSFKEENSALELQHLSMSVTNADSHTVVKDFSLRTENSDISLDADITMRGKDITSAYFSSHHSYIGSRDMAAFVPQMGRIDKSIFFDATLKSDSRGTRCEELALRSPLRDFVLSAHASSPHPIHELLKNPQKAEWNASVTELNVKAAVLEKIGAALKTEGINWLAIGDLSYKAEARSVNGTISLDGMLNTAAGSCSHILEYRGRTLKAELKTTTLKLATVVEGGKIGDCEMAVNVTAEMNEATGEAESIDAVIEAPLLTMNDYPYRNIRAEAQLGNETAEAEVTIQDINADITVAASADNVLQKINGGTKAVTNAVVEAVVNRLNPEAANITDRYPGAVFCGILRAECGNTEDILAACRADIRHFSMTDSTDITLCDHMTVTAESKGTERIMSLSSDFADITAEGRFNLATLGKSLTNLLAQRLPTIPGLAFQQDAHNRIEVRGTVRSTDMISRLLKTGIKAKAPISVDAFLDDDMRLADITIANDSLTLGNTSLKDNAIRIFSLRDTLNIDIAATRNDDNGGSLCMSLKGKAAGNRLSTGITWAEKEKGKFSGALNAVSSFYTNAEGNDVAHISIMPSEVTMGDSLWHLHPSEITYSKKGLAVRGFMLQHDAQHIIIDGAATQKASDSLVVALQDVNVAYIMNMVNFHSVEFAGLATGKAVVKDITHSMEAYADLDVRRFLFEEGRMGVLTVHATWDNDKGQINIDGRCNDDDVVTEGFYAAEGTPKRTHSDISRDGRTDIKGYISIKNNYIDLDIKAENTRAEFMHSFCSSFLDEVKVWANGRVRLWGDLSDINLTGRLVADGKVHVAPLNTYYTLRSDTVNLVINDILFKDCHIYDDNGNRGTVNGGLHHDHLSRMTFDIDVDAEHLLCFDFQQFNGSTFCGHVVGSGECKIKGRPGEVTFDINAYPEKGSEIAYNVASPDAIQNQEFITWRKTESDKAEGGNVEAGYLSDFNTNIRLNFLIHATPESTLRLLMDEKTGDVITLNGNGTLRATYYNKGGMQIFGNYNVVYGEYKMTMQKVIKKSFRFLNGGTLVFGGNPFEASINLQAQYELPSVPLADLNIGNSFKNNNVKVNCIMNITGTAEQPKVDFDLNIPQASAEVQKMITMAMDTEQRRMQQVVYLLSVGRFYAGESNVQTEQSQASLAMQSFLSGTLSQQLNNVISDVVLKNQNWNFGANISPGDEGMMNAEYEGLISGRMLNNRLLINGQFGYRDNANATTSFIGDFDVRYLLFPNGNLQVRVYNQTSDRYFIKSNLNTQGIGIIFRHDFKDFLPWIFRKKKE